MIDVTSLTDGSEIKADGRRAERTQRYENNRVFRIKYSQYSHGLFLFNSRVGIHAIFWIRSRKSKQQSCAWIISCTLEKS